MEEADGHQDEAQRKPPFWQRTTERLLSVTPIRKVSNEEYVDTLHARIHKAEQELRLVNGQMVELQQRLDQLRKEKDDFL